jgi:hypothetical protein
MRMTDRKALVNKTGKPHIFWDQWLKRWSIVCHATSAKNCPAFRFAEKLNHDQGL